MPWDAKTFASKHNKKLRGASAEKAAEMANAMIKSGTPEGVAIATANKHGNRMHAEGRRGRLYRHPRSQGK